jgi:hypothetical protein
MCKWVFYDLLGRGALDSKSVATMTCTFFGSEMVQIRAALYYRQARFFFGGKYFGIPNLKILLVLLRVILRVLSPTLFGTKFFERKHENNLGGRQATSCLRN